MLPLVKLLRPRQWTKNLACLAGVVFGDRLSQHGDIAKSIVVTVLFCAISSASYIFNDIYDCDRDRLHPQKKMRQIPSGQVSVSTAWIVAIVLGIPSPRWFVLFRLGDIRLFCTVHDDQCRVHVMVET